MKRIYFILYFIIQSTYSYALPYGFVYLDTISPSIIQDMRYASDRNFVGRPITGYKVKRCILTKRAADKLAFLQRTLKPQGLSLKVYDCYRPTRAVKAFVMWSTNKMRNQKSLYFPREQKTSLFQKGYIAEYSGHSRGSTVDLTLVANDGKGKKGVPFCYSENRAQDDSLDMGSNFDCLDVASHYNSKQINHKAKKNRKMLRSMMSEIGFRPYAKEWWHFTLRNEPYPRRYFNFPVK